MNPLENQITKMNTTSQNMTYLIDNKNIMCQYKKYHPLTSGRGKMDVRINVYRYLKIIQHDSHKYITSEGGDNLSNHKLTNCEIEYYQFFCSDCTKSQCLYINNKMSVLGKL